MKRLYKSILVTILACLLIAGSVVGTSAACSERVIYYVGGSGNCNSLYDCQDGTCPQSYGSLYDILNQYGCTEQQCQSLSELLRSYGCTDVPCIDGSCDNDCENGECPVQPAQPAQPAAPAETQAPVPATEAPASPAPAPKPTEAPAVKPTASPVAKPTEAPAEKPTEAKQDISGLSAYEQEVVRLVNEIRAQNGLGALKANAELSRVARIKSQDMHDKGYFSHTSPTYGSPFDMMTSFGIRYRTAGENIAMGYRTPQSVVDGWMNSPGHRANILNASFTEIGVGYVESGSYWTQMFIG